MTKTKRTRTASPAVLAALAKAREAKKAAKSVIIAAPAAPSAQQPETIERDAFFMDIVKHRAKTTAPTLPKGELVFFMTGDIGDIIATLPSVRHMGGGHIVIGERAYIGHGQGYGRESMKGARYEALRPLLEAQPYVKGVSWGTCPDGARDVSDFRYQSFLQWENIAQCIARHLKLGQVSEEPWLTLPGEVVKGPAVFARSPRYHQQRFPWVAIHDKHPDAVFVGAEAEHMAWERTFGRKIPYRKTRDFLELATLMAGAERCFCNQSSPAWVMLGLGVAGVMEVAPEPRTQNSVIERPNLRYVGNADQVKKNWY